MKSYIVIIGNYQVEIEANSAEEAKNDAICRANKKNPALLRDNRVKVIQKELLCFADL